MKKNLWFLLLILISSVSAVDMQYVIDLNYVNGDFKVEKIDVDFNSKLTENKGDNLAQIIDYRGNVLFENSFDFPYFVYLENNNLNGSSDFPKEVLLDEFSFRLVLPYFESAYLLMMYDNNYNFIKAIDLHKYSKNYKTDKEIFEMNFNRSIESVLEDEIIREENNSNEVFVDSYERYFWDYWWILLVVFLVLIIVLIRSIFFSENK